MIKSKKIKRLIWFFGIFFAALIIIVLGYYLLQRFYAHRNVPFVPTYKQVELTKDTDYETFFKQTGLGKAAVDKLISEDDFDTILEIQELFFAEPQVECTPMLGWFTREDRLGDTDSPPFADLQPGDILITLSTHSGGWRHGHAGIVIDEYTVLECQRLGTKSSYQGIYYWGNYSNYAVLRLKDITPELQTEIVNYCEENLKGVPYNLFSGIFGDKAPDPESENFGLYCSNLIWYALNHFGFDVDSDGGKIVSSYDILHSDEFEIVQIYGMDPNDFL